MSMHKDFDAMLREKAGEKPTFTIAGQRFTLRSKLAYNKFNELVAMMRDDGADNMESTRTFFNTVLIRDDRQRFLDLLDADADDTDDDFVIGLTQMTELTDWVMEHFTGKLPSSSSGSTPGSSATGQSPNVVSLNARTTAV
jgi:hypothetical protein